jgi:hypothetical protein
MAATVAIMLFMELPRVAFESQRDKEQLLIDRGEQYSRAIALYVRKFNRYPADFDALNNTQNLRFLRRKYVDPMTGKDDWRLIHVGPGGVFTDSLVYGKKKSTDASAPQSFITEMQQTGGNQVTANAGGVNVGTRQRPSDQPGAPGGQPGTGNGQQTTSNEPVMVLPDGRIVPVSQGMAILSGQSPQAGQPGQPGLPTVQTPGQPFPNNNGTNPAGTTPLPPGVQFPPGFQQAPNTLQNPTPGQPGQPNGPPAGATNLINQILTTPRPGGLNGLGGPPQATVDQNGNPVPANSGLGGTSTSGFGAPAGNNTGTPAAQLGNTGGSTIGGGIAGVASKREQDGIKTYKDKTSYHEWEFVYDITKDPLRGGGAAAAPAANPAAQGQNGAAPNTGNTFNQTNPSASPFSSTLTPFGTPNAPPAPPPPPTQGMPAPQ